MDGWEGGRGGHGPANPKSPFPRYKASSLFSALHVARLRADILCERSIGAADQIRAVTNDESTLSDEALERESARQRWNSISDAPTSPPPVSR